MHLFSTDYTDNSPKVVLQELGQLVTTTQMLQQQKQSDVVQSQIMGELS